MQRCYCRPVSKSVITFLTGREPVASVCKVGASARGPSVRCGLERHRQRRRRLRAWRVFPAERRLQFISISGRLRTGRAMAGRSPCEAAARQQRNQRVAEAPRSATATGRRPPPRSGCLRARHPRSGHNHCTAHRLKRHCRQCNGPLHAEKCKHWPDIAGMIHITIFMSDGFFSSWHVRKDNASGEDNGKTLNEFEHRLRARKIP